MNAPEEAVGPTLRAAREELRLSVPEVGTVLKVPNRVVEDIEAERFDALPARVFTRAYIRNYAALVRLDPETVLCAYDRQTGQNELAEIEARPLVAVPRSVVALAKRLRPPGRPSWVFGGTVVLIAALASLFLWIVSSGESPSAPAPVDQSNEASARDAERRVASVDEASPESATAPVPPSNERVEPAPGAVVERETAGSGTSERETPAAEGASASAPLDSTDGLPAGLADSAQAFASLSNPLTYTPGEDHALVFHFTHDCWVVVLDGAGNALHEDLERAEDRLEVRGEAPFTITLGYAPGVTLEYNGEAVMLAQHTNDNGVAKLVLGL